MFFSCCSKVGPLTRWVWLNILRFDFNSVQWYQLHQSCKAMKKIVEELNTATVLQQQFQFQVTVTLMLHVPNTILKKFIQSLSHWGRVTHICVSERTIIGLDNGLSPGRRQAIIWTSAGILLIGPLGTNFSEILIEIITFSFKKMRLKVSSAKWWPCCLGLNVLN